MKLLLEDLFQHKTITREQAREVLIGIGEGRYNPSHVASFLTVFRMRSVTVDELSGFREAMLELCVPVDFSSFDTIDVCGTGGDGKDTFNISTLTAFTLAACGVKVSKHGNYGVSSGCGSSNVLEELGVVFTDNVDILRRQLDKAGICCLHAPLFHPAMRHVGPIRKELGVRTFFNLLGPLVNPSKPRYQLTGVFSLEIARLYSYLLQQSETEAAVCHSLDGYDEVSLTGKCRVSALGFDRVLSPSNFGLTELEPASIAGGSSPAQGAKIFSNIMNGEGTPEQVDVVSANVALGLKCVDSSLSLPDGVEQAREAIASGKVKETFCAMKEIG
jgi:anthranilate phosphoribosyltransferase